MLKFDDDSGMTSRGGAAPVPALAPQPAAGFVASGLAAPAVTAPRDDADAYRRIRVEDKRIINGRTDVNQLVPF
jgi:ribonucleoside-diphosphate reductase beta chain